MPSTAKLNPRENKKFRGKARPLNFLHAKTCPFKVYNVHKFLNRSTDKKTTMNNVLCKVVLGDVCIGILPRVQSGIKLEDLRKEIKEDGIFKNNFNFLLHQVPVNLKQECSMKIEQIACSAEENSRLVLTVHITGVEENPSKQHVSSFISSGDGESPLQVLTPRQSSIDKSFLSTVISTKPKKNLKRKSFLNPMEGVASKKNENILTSRN